MLYKIRFVFFRYIRHWGCKLLFINAVQYIFILLVPIRFVLGVVLGFIVAERNGLGVDMFVSKNYHLYPLFTVFREIQNNSCHSAYT